MNASLETSAALAAALCLAAGTEARWTAPLPTSQSAALPVEARGPMEEGLAAAQRKQWNAAIESFAEAQQLAPFASTILFNLGVAHASAAHDLAAIAWLRAYLAAAPKAADRAAVQRQIGRTQSRVTVKVVQLSSVSQEIQGRLDAEGVGGIAVHDHAALLARTALLMGNRDAAVQAAAAIEEVGPRDDLWSEVAAGLTEQRDDLEHARWAARQIQAPALREQLLATVATAEARLTTALSPGVSRELADWQELARLLSGRDHAREIELAAEADVRELPLRLLRIASDLGTDYLRIQRLAGRSTTTGADPNSRN